MSIETIERAISMMVSGGEMGKWRIGLTHDLRERYEHWRETESLTLSDWSAWEADSLSDAQAVEASFIRRGMRGGTGGNLSSYQPVFVYIFA